MSEACTTWNHLRGLALTQILNILHNMIFNLECQWPVPIKARFMAGSCLNVVFGLPPSSAACEFFLGEVNSILIIFTLILKLI